MIIIGVDFHPEFQQIAMVDIETGELEERRLHHPSEAEAFYRESGEPGKDRACGNGGQWARTLVRAVAG